MRLINIHNDKRLVYLFTRDEKGKQKILIDKTFYPFYFEPAEDGQYVSYDGVKLKKIILNSPNEIVATRSDQSYSSDVRYVVNYLTHRVEKLEQTPFKYFFLDIEIFTKELPDVNNPKQPISCVTVYNSFKKEYKQFFLGDYQGDTMLDCEKLLMKDLVEYFQEEKPDLWLSWHVEFDYLYLQNRFKKFAKAISPIRKVRMCRMGEKTFAPAGISILDYLMMFKKVNLRESSYKLDSVAEKHLGYGKKHKEIRFDIINQELKERNLEDVQLMVALEEKFKILTYFDEIRTFSKCLWEDITHNSMIIDSIILDEAKKREIILPNKTSPDDREDIELQGAYRRSDEGLFENVYKADVGSMYPNQLVNFCLDSSNVVSKPMPEDGTPTHPIVNIKDYHFKQDQKALLPSLAIKLMGIKDRLKKELKNTVKGSDDEKVLQMKYDAYKGLVNSLYGVTAFPSFRLYDYAVASSITFLARDLLHYVEEKMQGFGHQVIYTDTDALMYLSDQDEIDNLNNLVQLWSKKYGKDGVNISFESEGKFTKMIIVGKCHYYGYIETNKGIKKEIKGMEMKRASSSKYESKFQEALIEKILNKESKPEILAWIKEQKSEMRNASLEELGFPCKLADKVYKSEPIFVRAYNNSRFIDKTFNLSFGDNFYYIYVIPYGKDSKGKAINVLAFTKDKQELIERDSIDWQELVRRNIDSKADTLFEAIKWKQKDRKLAEITLKF